MNKLQISIFVTADKVDFQENKVVPIEGYFYWNKQKYNIIDGIIEKAPVGA